ncbi:uncharacterized protein LOC111880418 [Lactuca sativa]|nr:uncharacterized protein LOC111880418 [Lactuca sativa]
MRDNTSKTSGHQFTLDLLEGTNNQCIELLRMSRDSYVRLCTHFRVKSWLKDSKHISVEEKMAMFLMMIGDNQHYVIIKRRFQHSKQTIHKYFYEVLDKMMVFAKDIIVPTSFNPNPNIPGHNRRLRRIFRGAVRALDGTLVHAIVPLDKQHLYRGRGKGDCYQNVLAICDFNMISTFVVAGWEGIAHDSRILSEALTDRDAPFPFPPLARFPILKRMAPFPLVIQRNIVIACFALHNYIIKEGLSDEYFSQYNQVDISLQRNNVQDDDDKEEDDVDEVQPHGSARDREYMVHLRDQIADQLMRVE